MKRRHMYWLPVLALVVAAFVPALMGCEDSGKTGPTDDREFALSINSEIENGKITTNPAPGNVKVNTDVTVSVTPDSGYALSSGSLKYNGKTITRTGGRYTFKMPAEATVVTAAFREQTGPTTGPDENPGQDEMDALGDWEAQLAIWRAELEPIVARMTLEQKAGQMTQGLMDEIGSSNSHDPTYARVPGTYLGSILAGGHNQPHTNFGSSPTPQAWRNFTNTIVDKSLEVTTYPDGYKIPLIFGLDCMHGASKVQDATMLPHNVGLGAIAVGDRNKGIQAAFKAAQLTSREMLGGGLRWTFGPVLGTAENIGWGRTYECYSENIEINAIFGKYFTRGLHLAGVATCPKHFGPEGQTTSNGGNANISVDQYSGKAPFSPSGTTSLESIRRYITPYEEAIKERTMSIMMSYGSRNSKRIHEDAELMMTLLKGEMGFQGMILTDWSSLDSITGSTYADKVQNGINAGIDMVMAANKNWVDTIEAIVARGTSGGIPMTRINDAVMRCLLFKKSIGHQSTISGGVCLDQNCNAAGCNGEHNFWNHPNMRATVQTSEVLRTEENRLLAKDLVADSMVLLKNEDQVIQRLQAGEFKNILLIGEATAHIGLQCGGWTIQWQGLGTSPAGTAGVNIQQGIEAKLAGTDMTVTRTAGTATVSTTHDVVIAVVSEAPYAEGSGDSSGAIALRTADESMMTRAYAVKNAGGEAAPVVMIVMSGRSKALTTHYDNSTAMIAAWLPGSEAGTGIAEMLFTDREYVGKSSYTWPRTRTGTAFTEACPVQYAYGHGLRKDNTPCECDSCL